MARRSDKVIDASPRWAPFSGWSVLLEHESGGIGVSCEGATAQLYEVCTGYGSALSSELGDRFALLPIKTLHVTVCDGPNSRHEQALLTPPDRPFDQPVSDLIDSATHRIEWHLECAEVRGFAVVVPLSTDFDLTEIESARRDVQRLVEDRGAPPAKNSWRPHVTIGYLVDDRSAAIRARLVGECWNALIDSGQSPSLTSVTAAVYAFDDMATWRRR